MLVLSRKVNESIIINGNIKVMLLTSKGGVSRLGIDAPPEMTIHREEIQAKIDKEKKQKGDVIS